MNEPRWVPPKNTKPLRKHPFPHSAGQNNPFPPEDITPAFALARSTSHTKQFPTMLLTHGILSAYFLSAFVATATPIPMATSPHVLPRISPDLPPGSLLMRGLDGRDNFQGIAHIEEPDTYEEPEEEHTSGKLDIRMADAATEGSESDVKDTSGNKHSLKFFEDLFEKLKPRQYRWSHTQAHKECAITVTEIALNLDNIDAEAIPKVASVLSRKRLAIKKHVRFWPSDSKSDQAMVVEGIRGWENALRKWSKDRHVPDQSSARERNFEKEFSAAKTTAEEIMTSIVGVDFQAELAKPSDTRRNLPGLCGYLSLQVLVMSIDDTLDLHTKLEKVAAHVQNNWLRGWPKSAQWLDDPRESIKIYSKLLNNAIMVFGSTASITTSTTPSKNVVTQ
ncbi:hypothetical protein H0H93_008736 [Arthromyces matolae]|nr:hypothetical protein H0H93_008736 [Arthromyces matolae]